MSYCCGVYRESSWCAWLSESLVSARERGTGRCGEQREQRLKTCPGQRHGLSPAPADAPGALGSPRRRHRRGPPPPRFQQERVAASAAQNQSPVPGLRADAAPLRGPLEDQVGVLSPFVEVCTLPVIFTEGATFECLTLKRCFS